MNFSNDFLNQESAAPILQAFAKYFSANQAFDVDQLDLESELTQQFTCVSSQRSYSATSNDNPGLYRGCPLSNDRRQLTSDVLFWCPFGWPSGNYESIVSSRLGNRLHQDPLIGNALRNFFLLTASSATIVNGQGTTFDAPVQRGCQLFRRQQLRLIPLPKKLNAKWIASSLIPTTDQTSPIYFDSKAISVDELSFATCDHVRVAYARQGGTVQRLTDRFRTSGAGPIVWQLVRQASSTAAAKHPSKTDDCHTNQTGIDWLLSEPHPSGKQTSTAKTNGTESQNSQIIELSEFDALHGDDQFLSHWTRSDRTPFPDQNPLNQFDTLFFENDTATSPLDTLCRILAQNKLLGSGKLIRGGQRAACFTEVPLREFAARRVFRPQLSRWDFELFGLAIRKVALQQLGGRSVSYVHETDAIVDKADEEGSKDVFNVNLSSNPKLDWSREREWRVLGDLDLRQIAEQDAFVFVADKASAKIAARLSRWKVVVVGGVLEESRSGHN